MTWLRKEAGLHPAAFMSDCCKALSKGIKDAFRHCLNPPKHYLCVVHVMKAARCKGTKIVSLRFSPEQKSHPDQLFTNY